MEEIYKTYWALKTYSMYNIHYLRELENQIIDKVNKGYLQGIHKDFIYNYVENDENEKILWVSKHNLHSNMWVHDDMGKNEGLFVECGVADVDKAISKYYEHGEYTTTKLNSCCMRSYGVTVVFNFEHAHQTIILERKNYQ